MLIRLFVVFALSFGVVGCAATGAISNKANEIAANIATASKTFNEKVAAAKEYIKLACNYVPTTASLITLFNSGIGTAVGTIGEAVCEAVRSAPLADGPATFRVNGVRVEGRFVRPTR